MSHKFSLPDESGLEYLITQAYESMPIADQSRLSLIESKLLQKTRKNKDQKNLNKIPWWIVLVLAGGFATAAWWTSNTLFHDEETEQIIKIEEHGYDYKKQEINNHSMQNETNKDTPSQSDLDSDKRSPVIYQRESF